MEFSFSFIYFYDKMSFLQAVLFFQPLPHFHFSLGKKKFFSAQGKIFLAGFVNALATKEKQSTDFIKPIDYSVCYPLTIYKTKLNNFNI